MYSVEFDFFTTFVVVAGSTGSDEMLQQSAAPPPPKPTRYPGSEIVESNTCLASLGRNNPPPVSSYIVAQNPEVLVHLLKENEFRGLNPSVYTTPASAFNTIAVDFKENTGGSGCSDFSTTDKTISAGNSLQSLNSISSGFSVAQSSSSFTNSNFNCLTAATAAASSPSSSSAIEITLATNAVLYATSAAVAAGGATGGSISNKSLPRNFGSGGGKLSAHVVEQILLEGGPKKSFSISSNEINQPVVNYRHAVAAKIPQRMSRSVDSAPPVVRDGYEKDEVGKYFQIFLFAFFSFF